MEYGDPYDAKSRSRAKITIPEEVDAQRGVVKTKRREVAASRAEVSRRALAGRTQTKTVGKALNQMATGEGQGCAPGR